MSSDPLELSVSQGPGEGQRYPVGSEALIFGSSPEADVVIQAPGVEPLHAQIVFQGGQVILTDLSTGGTYRNGQRLLGPLQVFPGDRIGLGPEVELILEGDDPRDAAAEESPDDLPGLVPDEGDAV